MKAEQRRTKNKKDKKETQRDIQRKTGGRDGEDMKKKDDKSDKDERRK